MSPTTRHILVFLILILAAQAVYGYDVALNLKDMTDRADISDALVTYSVGDTEAMQYLGNESQLRLSLDQGTYELVLIADRVDTHGKDYALKMDLEVTKDATWDVYMYPTATIKGLVKDKLGNVVPDANLKIECAHKHQVDIAEMTDSFGAFQAENIPACPCRILASHKGSVGYTDINPARGELDTNVTVMLDETLARDEGSYLNLLIVVAGLVLLILMGYGVWKWLSERTRSKASDSLESAEETMSNRQADILETLDGKQRAVVKHLMEQGNKSTQASIRHATGIPRTSLARVLKSLEAKKIITIKALGKMRKVSLTPWYLGND